MEIPSDSVRFRLFARSSSFAPLFSLSDILGDSGLNIVVFGPEVSGTWPAFPLFYAQNTTLFRPESGKGEESGDSGPIPVFLARFLSFLARSSSHVIQA